MNTPNKTLLALLALLAGGAVLAGCGSGESEVDPKAMDARNSQRSAAPAGAPPKSDAPTK